MDVALAFIAKFDSGGGGSHKSASSECTGLLILLALPIHYLYYLVVPKIKGGVRPHHLTSKPH